MVTRVTRGDHRRLPGPFGVLATRRRYLKRFSISGEPTNRRSALSAKCYIPVDEGGEEGGGEGAHKYREKERKSGCNSQNL